MGRLKDARALVDATDAALPKIEGLYQQSLTSRRVDQLLLVEIKNYLENLRSALDYLAKEVLDRFCNKNKGNLGGFPVVRQQKDFAARINGMLPGLFASRPDIYQMIKACQPYTSPGNEWLGKFNALCQENKHEQFSPQSRLEQKGTRLTADQGGSFSWSEGVRYGTGGTVEFRPGGKIVFGQGSSLSFGPDGIRVLGRRVDPATQTPITASGDKLEHVVWVDFRFDAIGESALPFLRACAKNVRSIIEELGQSLGPRV